MKGIVAHQKMLAVTPEEETYHTAFMNNWIVTPTKQVFYQLVYIIWKLKQRKFLVQASSGFKTLKSEIRNQSTVLCFNYQKTSLMLRDGIL